MDARFEKLPELKDYLQKQLDACDILIGEMNEKDPIDSESVVNFMKKNRF